MPGRGSIAPTGGCCGLLCREGKATLPQTVSGILWGKSGQRLALSREQHISLAWKHHVSPEEIEDILFGHPLYRKVQKGHIPGEDLYATLGQMGAGQYLIILFIYKSTCEALILSARDMDDKERRQYARG